MTAIDHLRAVLALVNDKAHSWPHEQDAVNAARAYLAEVDRRAETAAETVRRIHEGHP